MNTQELDQFAAEVQQVLETYMLDKNGRVVPARLQSAIGLLESVREQPSLDLGDHRSGEGSSGLRSHETLGNTAHKRLKLTVINKNHGRRSSNLLEWGQPLLDVLGSNGFAKLAKNKKGCLLDAAQDVFAEAIRGFLATDPIGVSLHGHSSVSFVREILEAARDRHDLGAVSQYLVGAKLSLRFPDREVKIHPVNKGDRKSYSDKGARRADFDFDDVSIEVAAGAPDPKHLEQVVSVVENTSAQLWVLTSSRYQESWEKQLEDLVDKKRLRRVVVHSIEIFIGQNISEIAGFSAKQQESTLRELVETYNSLDLVKSSTGQIHIEILD